MKQDWEIKHFEDCLEKIVYTNKIQKKDFLESGDYPIISQEQDFINGYWNNSDDLFEIKKPVVIFGDHTQVLKYVSFDFVLGADGVKILQTKTEIDPRFFYYFLQNINLGSLGYARHYRLLKEVVVHYPKSLSEQKYIVAILDETFAAIDKAKANTEKSLQNAKEFFESYLQNIFINVDNEKSLIELCEIFVDSPHRTPAYQDEGIPALRPRDVVNGVLNLSKVARVSQSEYEIQTKRYKPMPGDFVYSRELSYGWAAILPESPKICLSQGMCLFRPSHEISSSYLHYILNGSVGRLQAKNVAVGTAHPHVNIKDIKAYRIPVSSLAVQNETVEKLDALLSKTKKLEAIYQRKLNDLEELKKSILQKAFNGELTAATKNLVA